jgi:ComF family protein
MPNFESGADVLCGHCVLQPPAYSGARSFGYYSGELGRLIQGLKFNNRRNLVPLLVPFLIQAYYGSWDRDDFDLVVPIPLHPKRRRTRGYNQSEMLARLLARRTGIPFGNSVLIRKRSTLPQVGLTDTQRRENVRNAFQCINSGQISGRRILLIDDVMTTGATASSASAALMKGGALRVSVLTLARTE